MTTEARSNETADEFLRVPGLFRRWEIQEVLEAGQDFHLEDAGAAADGTPLYAVYRREPCRCAANAASARVDRRGAP